MMNLFNMHPFRRGEGTRRKDQRGTRRFRTQRPVENLELEAKSGETKFVQRVYWNLWKNCYKWNRNITTNKYSPKAPNDSESTHSQIKMIEITGLQNLYDNKWKSIIKSVYMHIQYRFAYLHQEKPCVNNCYMSKFIKRQISWLTTQMVQGL